MQTDTQISVGTTIRIHIDMVWLSKTWEWLKKNWKYVVTFGIPVLLSFIAGLLRSNRSLEKKVELEQDLRDVDNEANELESKLKEEALELRDESIANADRVHDAMIREIKDDMQKRFDEIETAEQATAAIKEKLDETD